MADPSGAHEWLSRSSQQRLNASLEDQASIASRFSLPPKPVPSTGDGRDEAAGVTPARLSSVARCVSATGVRCAELHFSAEFRYDKQVGPRRTTRARHDRTIR